MLAELIELCCYVRNLSAPTRMLSATDIPFPCLIRRFSKLIPLRRWSLHQFRASPPSHRGPTVSGWSCPRGAFFHVRRARACGGVLRTSLLRRPVAAGCADVATSGTTPAPAPNPSAASAASGAEAARGRVKLDITPVAPPNPPAPAPPPGQRHRWWRPGSPGPIRPPPSPGRRRRSNSCRVHAAGQRPEHAHRHLELAEHPESTSIGGLAESAATGRAGRASVGPSMPCGLAALAGAAAPVWLALEACSTP